MPSYLTQIEHGFKREIAAKKTLHCGDKKG
jgi:hypothetical protein